MQTQNFYHDNINFVLKVMSLVFLLDTKTEKLLDFIVMCHLMFSL